MQIPACYDDAMSRKYPEQVVLVIARDSTGKCNPMAAGWVMIASSQPPMMAVALGTARHTLEAIGHSREFVISFPGEGMAEDTLYYGTVSGRDEDKLAVRRARTQSAEKIECVLLSDAVASFECALEGEMPAGDHVIVVGRVVASHVNSDAGLRRLFNLGERNLQPLPVR